MKNQKNIIVGLIILLFCIGAHFVHYKRLKSFKQQIKLYNDLSNANYSNTPAEFYNNIQVDIPNLTATTIPLKAMKAIYITANEPADSVQKAIKLLHESRKENPFLMYSEGNLAQIYFSLRQRDSAYFYARKSFNGLPKNAVHYAMLSKLFANKNEYDSIVYYYQKINSRDVSIGKIFLASMNNFYNDLDLINKRLVLQITEDLKFINKTDKDLQLLADYIIYGEDLVEKALNFEEKGEKLLIQQQFKEGIELYEKALEIRKDNFPYIQTIALASFNLFEYKSVIYNLEKLEKQKIALDPLSLYIKGISHYNLREYSMACNYLQRAAKFEQKNAIEALESICQ